MATVRLKKYDQQLLLEIWQGIPKPIWRQLSGEAVKDIKVEKGAIKQAIKQIDARLKSCNCKALHRRLNSLRQTLSETETSGQ